MPSNSALGFAGGFLGGLQQSLQQNRMLALDAEARKQRNASEALKIFLDPNNPNPPRDIGDLDFLLATAMPEVFGDKSVKPTKGAPDHKAMITGILQSSLQGQIGGGMGAPQAGAAPQPGAQPQPDGQTLNHLVTPFGQQPPAQQAAPEAQAPAQSSMMLGGVPVMSREEAAAQRGTMAVKAAEQAAMGKVALLRRMMPIAQDLVNSGVFPTLRDAQVAMGIDVDTKGRSATDPQTGSFGDLILRKEDELGRPLTTEEIARARIEWQGTSRGIHREALALSMFGANTFSSLTPEQAAQVIEAEKTILAGQAQARAEGTGAGKQNVPIDIPTSQATGLPVGTTPTQLTGQVVPTADQRTQRRVGEALKGDLNRLTGDGTTPGLLDVLPSDKETGFGKVFPGALMMYRKRASATRAAVASLESVVEGMVNDLARYRGQRGAQTEGDVERAYATLVNLKTSLTDPFGGDTRESALARIKEAQAGIERVASSMVPEPVPTAKPGAAAPAAGAAPAKSSVPLPNGYAYDANGRIVIAE